MGPRANFNLVYYHLKAQAGSAQARPRFLETWEARFGNLKSINQNKNSELLEILALFHNILSTCFHGPELKAQTACSCHFPSQISRLPSSQISRPMPGPGLGRPAHLSLTPPRHLQTTKLLRSKELGQHCENPISASPVWGISQMLLCTCYGQDFFHVNICESARHK